MTKPAVDVNSIRSVDWSRRIGAPGDIVEQLPDIDQAMRICLLTPKGAVEHRPQFGCDAWRYLDWPTNESLPHIVREATDALAQWEPRARVTGITASCDAEHVSLTIRWAVRLGAGSPAGQAVQTTEISYALTRPQ